MRRFLPDLIELGGYGCVVAAAWLFALPLGLLVLGIVLLLIVNTRG